MTECLLDIVPTARSMLSYRKGSQVHCMFHVVNIHNVKKTILLIFSSPCLLLARLPSDAAPCDR